MEMNKIITEAIAETIKKGIPDGASVEERRFMVAENFFEFLQRGDLPTDREGCDRLVEALEQYVVWEVEYDCDEDEEEPPWSLKLFFKSICIMDANVESPSEDWNSFLRSL